MALAPAMPWLPSFSVRNCGCSRRKGRNYCPRKWVAINRIRFCYFFTSVPIPGRKREYHQYAIGQTNLQMDVPIAHPSPLSTENPTTGGLVYEYLSTLYPPNHDVMQHTRRVKAGFSWHGGLFPVFAFLC